VGIPADEIVVGKCYLTALGQIRRVLKFGAGKVTYESRGAGEQGRREVETNHLGGLQVND
jgi:hypothetical protein